MFSLLGTLIAAVDRTLQSALGVLPKVPFKLPKVQKKTFSGL